ncbi:MAG: ABC transporter [Streptosporangiales bacterium]|nr:ABC transporter [Streptosporangiales bacterium]
MTEHPPPSGELAERIDALTRAVDLGEGRLPAAELAAAVRVLERARDRQRLSADHTVVALAGSTGSGKSSLFNALSGIDLSAVGVRRPTTGAVHACVWGLDGAAALLDWLGVPAQHRVARDTVLDTAPSPLAGLVLLDLPDHDSDDPSHLHEVKRLVDLVDALVWVMDPQKYADRVVHEEFLQPMAGHGNVVIVALNQVDRLEADEVAACEADLRRLLVEEDGLEGVRVVPTSATAEAGAEGLRTLLEQTVREKRAAADRLTADIASIGSRLDAYCDSERPVEPDEEQEPDGLGVTESVFSGTETVGSRARDELVTTISDAAGVGTLATAVAEGTRRHGLRVTGWPPFRLARRLRRTPTLRLPGGEALTGLSGDHTPSGAPIQLAQVDGALRVVSASASAGLPVPWPGLLRDASRSRADELVDVVDRVLADADVGIGRIPVWWRLAWLAQLLLLLCALCAAPVVAVAGLVLGNGAWSLVAAVLAGGAIVLGLGIDLLSRLGVRSTARHRREGLVTSLRDEVSRSVREHVVGPVENELDAHAEIRRELAVAVRA